jgi:hypothetical protein
MRPLIVLLLLNLSFNSFGQYPFERHPGVHYTEYKKWKQVGKNGDRVFTLAIPKFFNKKDSLTIQLSSSIGDEDSSFITLFRNGKQIQRFFEPINFNQNVFAPVRVADINGDHMLDCKLLIPYMGNGLASLNTRVIYLFQHKDESFTKISYLDVINGKNAGDNRSERDFNKDGNFEIIAMSLATYNEHSYWVFNLYNVQNNDLVSVNAKYNYPILIQCLFEDNFKIANNISREKMKTFAQPKPEDYDKR